jgi:hypothetical protein
VHSRTHTTLRQLCLADRDPSSSALRLRIVMLLGRLGGGEGAEEGEQQGRSGVERGLYQSVCHSLAPHLG